MYAVVSFWCTDKQTTTTPSLPLLKGQLTCLRPLPQSTALGGLESLDAVPFLVSNKKTWVWYQFISSYEDSAHYMGCYGER